MASVTSEVHHVRSVLQSHPFTRGLPDEVLTQLAPLGRIDRWEPGAYLLREGQPVEHFYPILSGRVAVEVYQPDRGVLHLQTLGRGDAVGWSWVLPPYRAAFDIRVLEPTETLSLPAEELRNLIDEHPEVGLRLLKKLLAMMAARIQAARLQLLDLYHRPT